MFKLTVFTQNISSDSVKCFSYEQCRKIAADLKKGEICDSISQNQELQILNFKEILRKDEEVILLNNEKIGRQEKELNTLNLKFKISKMTTKIGIPTAIIGGFFIGYLIK